MYTKQPLIGLRGKHYSAVTMSVSARMRVTVLTCWVMSVRMYPCLPCVQSLHFALREGAQGDRGVNEGGRFDAGVRARGGRSEIGQKIDAL